MHVWPCVCYCHVSVIAMCLLLPCVCYCHVSVIAMCLLLPLLCHGTTPCISPFFPTKYLARILNYLQCHVVLCYVHVPKTEKELLVYLQPVHQGAGPGCFTAPWGILRFPGVKASSVRRSSLAVLVCTYVHVCQYSGCTRHCTRDFTA